ncbi:diphosphate--fructose-6-phosphate 1-phosphotransferase [Paenibacillus allorhizosphaerae]|nr:diphosphate--fructose-6-phosphate 1-phosphotransferase [Paenibacillus allorhizosphaerae]
MAVAGLRMRYDKKIAVIQSGGPTAVLNSSLFGLLQEIGRTDERANVIGIRQGLTGLVNGDFFNLDLRQSLDWLQFQPGAVLGAGRMAFTNDDLTAGVEHLKRADIRALVLLGGNGTMAAGDKLAVKAKEMGYELQVIGIPKTVDNDIVGTDHTPGFPSAAKFVARAVRDLSTDLEAMKNFEHVRIIETMGRNVGWLTAASIYYKERMEDGPHLVYVPEIPFDSEAMLRAVSDIHSRLGYCVVVVSEGLKGKDGQPIMMNGMKQNTQSKALGGVGSVLAESVSTRLGLACRYENLGILQRCATFAVSELDRMEAAALGRKAAQLILRGESGMMVRIERLAHQPYKWEIGKIAFAAVAGKERELDSKYISADGTIHSGYRRWLAPFMDATNRYRTIIPISYAQKEENS